MSSLPDPRDAQDLANLRALGIDPDKLDIGPGGADLLPKRDDRELVTAQRLLEYVRVTTKADAGAMTVHPWVIAALQPVTLTALEAQTHAQPALFWREVGLFVAHGQLDQVPVTIVGLPTGAAAAITAFEELIAAGGQQFVILGTAGSLHPSLPLGSLVLPVEALREEGTSFHYVPAGTPVVPDAALVEQLAESCAALATPFRRGPVWTTDAPFRDLATQVSAYAAMGMLAADMETAALFAVAMLRGVRLAVLLTIADIIADPWQPGFLSPTVRAANTQLAAIAAHCIVAGAKARA